MPKTNTTPLAPMDPDTAFSAFRYHLAVQARDIDAACEVPDTEPQLDKLLADVAERIITPVTALPGPDREPCEDSFALEAPGRIRLGILRAEDDVCPAPAPGITQAIIRFTEEILTEDHEDPEDVADVADVLEQLAAVAVNHGSRCPPRPGGVHRTPPGVRAFAIAIGRVGQAASSGLTTVSTKSPMAPRVRPSCSICGKWPASGMGAKWPLGKESA